MCIAGVTVWTLGSHGMLSHVIVTPCSKGLTALGQALSGATALEVIMSRSAHKTKQGWDVPSIHHRLGLSCVHCRTQPTLSLLSA